MAEWKLAFQAGDQTFLLPPLLGRYCWFKSQTTLALTLEITGILARELVCWTPRRKVIGRDDLSEASTTKEQNLVCTAILCLRMVLEDWNHWSNARKWGAGLKVIISWRRESRKEWCHSHQKISLYGNILGKFWGNFDGSGITPSYFFCSYETVTSGPIPHFLAFHCLIKWLSEIIQILCEKTSNRTLAYVIFQDFSDLQGWLMGVISLFPFSLKLVQEVSALKIQSAKLTGNGKKAQ